MKHAKPVTGFFLGILLTLSLASVAHAADATLDVQAKKIEAKLVSPCCWTYPVSEHHSELANQIKGEIRTMLSEGKSETEILSYFSDESRFGERILTTPTTRGFNVMIWIFPFVIFILGGSLLYAVLSHFRKKSAKAKDSTPAADSPSEQDSDYRKRLDDELYRSED